MVYILIKAYPKDDYLAALCYKSFNMAGIDANYFFFADEGDYKYILDMAPIISHKSFDGYGGSKGVRGMIKALKDFKFNSDDIVVLVDDDVVVRNNFLKGFDDFDHAGVGGISKYTNGVIGHISGQMQILKGWVINKIINEDIESVLKEMLSIDLSINDDTFLSYLTDKWNCKKVYLPRTDPFIADGWYHKKFYEYEGMNFTEALNKILSNG